VLVSVDETCLFYAVPNPTVMPGCINMNALQRQSCSVEQGEKAVVAAHAPLQSKSHAVGKILMEIKSIGKSVEQKQLSLDVNDLSNLFLENFNEHFIAVGQAMALQAQGRVFCVTAVDITYPNSIRSSLFGATPCVHGQLKIGRTVVSWKNGAGEEAIQLVGQGRS